MGENKTQVTKENPEKFLNTIEDKVKREDSLAILKLMKKITGEKPKMWGPSIVGFGDYHYKYESGREGDFFITGFSPRKQNLTIYIMPGFDKYEDLLLKLGKYKTSVSCLYIKRLSDIDINILEKMIKESYSYMKKNYPRAEKK